MESAAFMCIFIVGCIGFGLTYANRGPHLCQEKKIIYNTQRQEMNALEMRSRPPSYDTFCPKASEFISHAMYSRRSCPNWPFVTSSSFHNAVGQININFDSRCLSRGYRVKATGCSPAMVRWLVNNCTNLVDQVQPSLPRLEVCQISQDFIACYDRAQIICDNDADLFHKHNIPHAVEATRNSLGYLCNEQLRDVPWMDGPRQKRSTHTEDSADGRRDRLFSLIGRIISRPTNGCPKEIQVGESVSNVCTAIKDRVLPNVDLSSDFQDICGVFEFMRTCSRKIFVECDGFVAESEKEYLLNNFDTVYNAYGCNSGH